MSNNNHQPNVLVFIPHDLGDYLGCYGHRVLKSPNLDGLAKQGIRFTNHFAVAPECTASRSGMLTGLYPHQNGLMGLAFFGWNLHPDAIHLAKRLRQTGYSTHLFGLQHEAHKNPSSLGYEHIHAHDNLSAASVCKELNSFLGSNEAKQRPWFAHAGFMNVHRPWHNTPVFTPEDIIVPPFLPDNPVIRKDFTHFYQSILEMDTAIGETMETLKQSGLDENTVAIFTTDHGCPFPRAKATFYDPGIKIPLIVRWPGRLKAGLAFDRLTSNVDFTPTVLDICGSPIPAGLEGRSLLPLIEGREYLERDAVYGDCYYDVSYDPIHYVRTQTHKYIRSFAVTPEDARGINPDVLCTHGSGSWIRFDDFDVMSSASWRSMNVDCSPPPAEELYDLKADPLEQNNLVGQPGTETILESMRERLQKTMKRTQAKLLKGHIPPPRAQEEGSRKLRHGNPGSTKKK
ncbi:sulfatase [Verrucomicrobiota bacterium]